MTTLVVGATGATGRLLTACLLQRGEPVRALVRRAPDALPVELQPREGLTLVQGTVLDRSDASLAELVDGCDAVACCLGHNLSPRGIFGPPYRLVARSVERLAAAAMESTPRPRLVVMGSSGVRDAGERVSLGERAVLGALRLLVPPHADNERTAAVVRRLGSELEWCVVRPDGLVDVDEVTPYVFEPAPTRSAIFDAGHVARIQVADAMARLATEDELWREWRGRMPVLYDAVNGAPGRGSVDPVARP